MQLEKLTKSGRARRALCKFAGAILKFYKSTRRSKLAFEVTCLKSMTLSYLKGQDIRNTYTKYEHPISYSKIPVVMANVQK